MDENKIPESFRPHVTEKLDKLVNDFQVATPSAVVDLARDAGSAIMTATLIENKLAEKLKDLGESANIYSEHCKSQKKTTHFNIAHCAKILANLHNQNKSVEQLKSRHRPIGESEAEIAVRCLDQIIRDLGWEK